MTKPLLVLPFVSFVALVSFGCAGAKPAAPAAVAAPSSTPAPAPAPETAPLVDGPTAKRLVAGGARLVDVRTLEEYGSQHLDGAENVPVDTLATTDIAGPKDAPVVVYCRSGKRSARAAARLRELGHTKVYDLGAMTRWSETSAPQER